ncbi:MAG: host attachment protein [Gammaproteobacteria bacterium]|nr:host attachment protein [Gammaproteobacteria bacterium]
MSNLSHENWTKHWIVAADSARARLFTMKPGQTGLPEALEEQEDVAHPEGRLRDQDLVTDDAGRTGEGGRVQRHTFASEKSEQDHEREKFARRLADHLDHLRATGKLETLDVVAAPTFLGELRNAFDDNLSRCVKREVDADLVHESSESILRHIRQE